MCAAIACAAALETGALTAPAGAATWTWGATNHTWSTGGWGLNSPALGPGDTIYVGAHGTNDDVWLHSFAPDGTTNWALQLWGNRICKGPAIGDDGTVYVGSSKQDSDPDDGVNDGVYTYSEFYAVSPSGTVVHTWYLKNWNDGCPAIAPDGTIYIGDVYNLWSLNPSGGANWYTRLTGWVGSSPAVWTNGHVLQPILYAFAGGDPVVVQEVLPGGSATRTWETSGLLDADVALAENGTIYIGDRDGNMYAFAQDGDTRWTTNLGARIRGGAVVAGDGTVYIGTQAGDLWALSYLDGSVEHVWETGGGIRAVPHFYNNESELEALVAAL